MKNKEFEHKIYEFANRSSLIKFLWSHEWDRVDDGDIMPEFQIDLDNLYWLRVPVEAVYTNYGEAVQDALITIARAYDYSSEIESVFRIIDVDKADACVDLAKESLKETTDKTELTDILDVLAKAVVVCASRANESGDEKWMNVAKKAADNCQYAISILLK